MDSFGLRLTELRKNAGLSQEEMADLLDVSRQSISKWENDKAYPEMTRLLFMSDYFKVSLDYLMRGTETSERGAGIETGEVTKSDVSYNSVNLFNEWLNFLSNLSDKQKALFVIICILILIILFVLISYFLYYVGYEVGSIFYRIFH